jgi:hypothetical protein
MSALIVLNKSFFSRVPYTSTQLDYLRPRPPRPVPLPLVGLDTRWSAKSCPLASPLIVEPVGVTVGLLVLSVSSASLPVEAGCPASLPDGVPVAAFSPPSLPLPPVLASGAVAAGAGAGMGLFISI